MPNMANITVKKNDNTTDIIYNALSPSGGDKIPARWEVTAAAAVRNRRPQLEVVAYSNGRNGRRITVTHRQPAILTEGSIERVVWKVTKTETFVDEGFPDADIAESTAQHANLLKSTLIQDSLKTGFAPT